MKIFWQLDDNDCGISVTQSLIYHFYKKKIEKSEIYNCANITQEGISLLELERINKKFGIEIESYNLTFDEFKDLKIKDYFVVLLNFFGKTHYVIGKKFKNRVKIFDSTRGKFSICYEELKTYFLNIFIAVKSCKTVPEITETKIKYQWLGDLKFLYKVFLIEAFSFAFLVINLLSGKLIYSDSIYSQDIKNLGAISFFGFILLISWSINEYLKEIFIGKCNKKYTKELYSFLFKKLENKKNFFHKKMGKQQFFYLPQHIQNISTFCTKHLGYFAFNVCLIFGLSIYLTLINVNFLIIIFLAFILQISYSFGIYISRKEYFPELIKSSHNQKEHFFDLNNFLNQEWNSEKFKSISFNLQNEITNEIDIEEKMMKKNVLFEKSNFFIYQLSCLFIYSIGAAWNLMGIMTIEQTVTVGFIYYYLNSSFKKIIDVLFFYQIYKKSWSTYLNWINVENIDEKSNVNFLFPNQIDIENLNYQNGQKIIFKNLNLVLKNGTFIFGKSGSGKSTLYKCLSNQIPDLYGKISFDQIDVSQIDQKEMNEKVIYQNSSSYIKAFDLNEITKTLNDDLMRLIKDLLLSMNLEIKNKYEYSELSSGQCQLLNVLNLLKYKEKILLLDEVTSHINKKNKIKIFKNVFPLLIRDNFVICSEHDLSLKRFFPFLINLEEKHVDQ